MHQFQCFHVFSLVVVFRFHGSRVTMQYSSDIFSKIVEIRSAFRETDEKMVTQCRNITVFALN